MTILRHITGGAVLVAAALCASAPPALAQGAPPPDTADRAADAALQGTFALGLALIEAERARDAARVFSTILAEEPGNTRVRLELARAHFQSRQWGRARAEFLSVLSGDIPDPVRANVLRFLRAIDARRGVDWDVDVALVTLGDTRDHDSGTSVVIGLPFTLDGRDGETARGLRHALGITLSRDIPHRSRGQVRAPAFGRLAAAGDEGPGDDRRSGERPDADLPGRNLLRVGREPIPACPWRAGSSRASASLGCRRSVIKSPPWAPSSTAATSSATWT